MKIEKTNIIDHNYSNDQASFKILLAEDLIEHFQPLFCEELRKKQRELKNNRSEILILKESVSKNRKILTQLDQDILKEELKRKILFTIKKQIDLGQKRNLFEGILLKVENQTLEQLEQTKKELRKILETCNSKKGS